MAVLDHIALLPASPHGAVFAVALQCSMRDAQRSAQARKIQWRCGLAPSDGDGVVTPGHASG
ncbi:hypothetical protein SM19410_09060 [Xanthomonas hortorum pv. gardneri]|nr:hypothetical protein BJD10_09135 [Xanthomonas hortorum pv. gardneri]ASW46105.1 hypothetical protein XJ27_09165 [Xanthomonas hortorum]PPU38953.1 hypothetical protein XcyCFBP4188_17685 [Xanthomonas hortorum pv. cynarae]APP83976.1 hypothetical protein BI317_07005 [Xanthomonas hortorum pv. gardneri]KLA98060.1 hypothetical protein SM19410_09060 [Xanthomonas hortorum pv. gardneri]